MMQRPVIRREPPDEDDARLAASLPPTEEPPKALRGRPTHDGSEREETT